MDTITKCLSIYTSSGILIQVLCQKLLEAWLKVEQLKTRFLLATEGEPVNRPDRQKQLAES